MGEPFPAESARLEAAYARRADSLEPIPARLRSPGDLFILQERERLTARILTEAFPDGLGTLRVLDLGCGTGWDLLELRTLGVGSARTVGLDLLAPRLRTARQLLPDAALVRAHGGRLPFSSDQFDLILAFTVFSSILDEEQRRTVAGELRRVIRSGGVLMWYDLRVDNPRNSDVRAVPSRALADLFPSWSIQLRSVTLAPPLARMVVPRSWLAAQMLSALPLLRTHLLGCLRKP
ncbi:MAG TPA: class I SAM-dependent methyltransferase [Gemmatimonadales bacterium]|nr:class I SAM-dependent methyltransferase [Gemmatimonadales bacterium]